MSHSIMGSYDFIIVGAGPSGCLLASRLARAFKDTHILLVEAGNQNNDIDHQGFGDRYFTLATAPGYNWGYKTVPQENLEGRAVDQSRGKGLGGSTAINFCVYTRGPECDYDRWSRLVEDDAWSWSAVQQRYLKIEKVAEPRTEYRGFVNLGNKVTDSHGEVEVGFPHGWDPDFGTYLEDAYSKGYPSMTDVNSGNPIGLGVLPFSISKNHRVTASTAFLRDKPANLTIMTGTVVERLAINKQKVTGIITKDGTLAATKEVILSAGAIDSPKTLLLSGIGPKNELDELGIACTKDLPAVGKNLHDRLWLQLVTVRKPGTPHRSLYLLSSPETLEPARKQWRKDETGPLLESFLPQMIGYLKSRAVLDSKEFSLLDPQIKSAIQASTSPDFELVSHISSPSVKAPEQYIAIAAAFMNIQSSGSVTLRTSNASDPALVDPKFLHEDFDKRVAIEATRAAMGYLEGPVLKENHVRFPAWPDGDSDEDILKFVQKRASSMWHSCGTVAMGRENSPSTCVDKNFRVVGLKGLRVVDLSVAPFLLSAHTQSIAYLIGQTAAEKIIEEYAELCS